MSTEETPERTQSVSENSGESSLLPSETHRAPSEQENNARAEWLHRHGAPAHYVLLTAWEVAVMKEHADMLRDKAKDWEMMHSKSIALIGSHIEAEKILSAQSATQLQELKRAKREAGELLDQHAKDTDLIAKLSIDVARLVKVDRMITEDCGFRIMLRWDNAQDVMTIEDAHGNVWGEAYPPEDSEDAEGEALALRATIDSIRGHSPIRRRSGPPDEEAEDILDWLECATTQNSLFGKFLGGGSPTPLRDYYRKNVAPKNALSRPAHTEELADKGGRIA